MALETRYAARRDWPVERLVESLAALLPVRRRRIARSRITFLDTLDGRVSRAGACLTLAAGRDGNRIEWRQGSLCVGCTLSGTLQFAWDLPQGPVREQLEPVVQTRRLLPLAEAEQEGVLLDVMDETHKTIARLDIVAGRARAPQRRAPWRPFQPFLTLRSLRGYDEQCAVPIAIIESRPGIVRSDHVLQGHVLDAIGASLPQAVAANRVELEPTVSAGTGLLRIQGELLRMVDANHAGVLAGIDSEFLRGFRAGAGRGLALLELMSGVLAEATIDYLRTELSWLTQITGPARDLDVLLLGLRSAPDALDAGQQGAILGWLEHERAQAQQALAGHLAGGRYRQLVSRWAEAVSGESPPGSHGGCGAMPLATLVSERARRLYHCVLADIEHVHGDMPAQELDRVRAQAQELHDLIDAASALYGPQDLAVVRRALEPLLSVLIEYDDVCGQASWLRRHALKPGEAGHGPDWVRRAAEALADRADRRAQELRKSAIQQFLLFGAAANRAAFERLFHIEHPTELVK